MKTTKKSIGIIGGGLLGMTLAFRLAQKGLSITLIEASERMGGLASQDKIGNYIWDRFYHVIHPSDSNLIDLLDELNLTDLIKWKQTKTGFFTEGRLYSMSNVIEFLTFPPLNLIDKIRLGLTIFYASKIKSWKRLEGILVNDWLKRLSGERTFNKIWRPLLKSKLSDYYRITNASFIWAIISRMYKARQSGMKKEMFGYVKGGYATIIDCFQRYLDNSGIEIFCQTGVTRILNNKQGVKLETATGESFEFDEVILTIPCTKIPELCLLLSKSEKDRFHKVAYQGIICAALILKKPLAGYYITNITDERVPFTAVIEMTAVVDRDYFNGNSLIYLPRYLSREDPLWKKNDKEIEEEFLTALGSVYPTFNREDLLFFRISKESHVFPITTLHYSSELLPPTRTSLEHVFVVNSAQIANGPMTVNEVVGLGNKKSKEIAEILC